MPRTDARRRRGWRSPTRRCWSETKPSDRWRATRATRCTDFKHLLGRRFTDPVVQAGIQRWPFQVVWGENDSAEICVHADGEVETFKPEDIGAILLKKLLKMAEDYIAAKPATAVITVPVYFTDRQRRAMRIASRLAGLEMVRLLHEPVTAPFAIDTARSSRERTVVVVDVGASAVNTALVTMKSGIVDTLAVAGDVTVGGTAFDRRLVAHLVDEVQRLHQIDVRKNWQAMERLRMVAEFATESLSEVDTTPIPVGNLVRGVDLNIELSRAQLEHMCGDLFQQLTTTIERLFVRPNGSKRDLIKDKVAEVVVAGGASRIPLLERHLQQVFNGKPLQKSTDRKRQCAVERSRTHQRYRTLILAYHTNIWR